MLRSFLYRVITVLLVLTVNGCGPVLREQPLQDNESGLVWPRPPERARIRYLYSFYEPADLGIRPGMLERFVALFTGNEGRHMSRPYAIAANRDMIAVADPGLRVVHLYLTASDKYEVITEVGGEQLESPVGISLGENNIYLADSMLGKVFILDRSGRVQQVIAGLSRPTGIVYEPINRRIYVADTLANRIVVFNDKGEQVNAFGARGGGLGEFNYPTTLSLYKSALYVNDTMNFRIQSFDLEGSPLMTFGRLGDGSGQFAHSKGLGMDREGHLYVADALSNYIQIFDSEGRFLLAFGGMGTNKGRFRLPAGIFVLDNRIFVADSQNRRVQVFQYIGGNP